MKYKARIAITCLGLLFVLGLISLSFSQKQALKVANTTPLTDNWAYCLNQKAPVPLSIPTHLDYFQAGDMIDLYTTLPITSIKEPFLQTKFYLQYVKIYLDDELIYSYNGDLTLSGNHKLGSGLLVIPLPTNYANKTLHIQYIPTFNSITNYIFPIFLTDCNLTQTILQNNIETLYLNAWFLFAGILSILYSIYLRLLKQSGLSFFFIGLFAITTAIWFLCNTKCLQLITQNLAFIHQLEYLCFYFIYIPLWLFFTHIVKEQLLRRYCIISLIPSIIFFLVAIILNISGIADFFHLLSFYHILIVVNAILISFLSGLLIYKNHPLSHGLLIGLLCLILASILEILKFYMTNIKIASFLNYGLILFFLNVIYAAYHPFLKPTKPLSFLKHHS